MFTKLWKNIRLLFNKRKESYVSLHEMLGFYPNDIRIYEQAFIHKSASIEKKWKRVNNERLEFLGDAILEAIITYIIYENFTQKHEGFLTKIRSKIVQRETLNDLALQLKIDKCIIYSAKIHSHNNHMYGNALEALIGAIYLDQGYQTCYTFVQNKIIKKHINLNTISHKEFNFKSKLLEWSQKNKVDVKFNLIRSFSDEEGELVFQSEVTLLDDIQIGIGQGYSKRDSQQEAAQMALNRLESDKDLQQLISDFQKKVIDEYAALSFKEILEDSVKTSRNGI